MLGWTQFYKPVPVKPTTAETMFSRESLHQKYRHGIGLDAPDFDFFASSSTRPIMSRRIGMTNRDTFDPQFFDIGKFQITYKFSDGIRNNKFPIKSALPLAPGAQGEYGAPGWSFRMLYEFLCEAYNGGVPFVDTYFECVFKTRPVSREFQEIRETIQDDINNEQYNMYMQLPKKADGTPDERFAAYKKYSDFKVWQKPIVRNRCKHLAAKIRHDIEVCLRTGKLRLRGHEGAKVSRQTRQLRSKLGGLHANQLFYASGQLIKDLSIYVQLGGKAA